MILELLPAILTACLMVWIGEASLPIPSSSLPLGLTYNSFIFGSSVGSINVVLLSLALTTIIDDSITVSNSNTNVIFLFKINNTSTNFVNSQLYYKFIKIFYKKVSIKKSKIEKKKGIYSSFSLSFLL